MKKNNYVQQLWADNPVFIVWKKIPLSMKLLFVFCFCFVGLLCANDSYAQRTMISVKAQNLTVKEVLSQIEAQSDFSFFYNDHHIDVDRRVSVVTEQSNIFTLLNEVFKNTNVKYAVRNKKIILSTQIVEAPAAKQTVQIKGKVTDMFGDPVIGATVMEDGTQNGTITDLDGNFILNTASANVTITVSYVGYMSQTVKAQPGKSLSVILKEDTKTLDEIVVVGFGTQKKVNLTGSVSTVNAEDLLSRPVSNVSQALQGLVPGMNFSYASDGNGGEIGADMKVNIRGAGTIGDGSNASPLILIDGMEVKEAIAFIAEEVEKRGIGKSKINYRLRDAIFSRQRYWGEPFPVYYKDSMPYMIDEAELPLELPEIDKYLPTENGEPPLGRAKNWTTKEGYPIELNTMPGFAGSSAYYLRYMDPHNDKALVSHEADAYWRNVDLYLGGAEHATGHLIYSRFWNMFLYDLGVVCEPEPFKKLINQGMIQGRSNFVYRIVGTNTYVSAGLKSQYETTEIHVDVNIVKNDILDTEAFRKWMPDYADAEFILEDGKYICGWAVEKMSKSMFNVVNPDDIIEQFGADTLRLYEMFLGPLEAHKPWDTQGIDGVYKFLRKFWRLFLNGEEFSVSDEVPTKEELKVLHKTLKKIEFDIENFSFNTSIPAFMICTNELAALKCNKRAILEPLVVAIAPYAPHIAEELWHLLGHAESVTGATFPQWEEKYLVEDSFEYPVSFNGKVRFKLNMPLTATQAEIEAAVKASPEAGKWLEGKEIRKMIIVPKKIVNVVIA